MNNIKHASRLLLSLILLTAMPGLKAQNEADSEAQWAARNLQATDELVIPAYRDLENTAQALQQAIRQFCAAPGTDSLQLARNAFHTSMDSWQAIQHVQFGPITYFNWNYRLQYWPDERGTAARQLNALLAAANADVLNPDNFARQSVGVQGLPALERMLFADTALADYQANPYLCQLSETIGNNIIEITSGVTQRWVDEYRDVVLAPASGGVFENSQDLSIEFLKALQEAIARIRDIKLAPVLGESMAQARLRNGESWRSMRSLDNIEINLANLEPLFLIYSEAFLPEDAQTVEDRFALVRDSFMTLPGSFAELEEDAELYAQLQNVLIQVDSLHESLETSLKNTDLYLGFNSLDGD